MNLLFSIICFYNILKKTDDGFLHKMKESRLKFKGFCPVIELNGEYNDTVTKPYALNMENYCMRRCLANKMRTTLCSHRWRLSRPDWRAL